MRGKYKAAIALLLLIVLLPLTLLLTLAQWVPTLAGIWLPAGTRIAFEKSPRLTRNALVIADLPFGSYQASPALSGRRLRNRPHRRRYPQPPEPLENRHCRAGSQQCLPE